MMVPMSADYYCEAMDVRGQIHRGLIDAKSANEAVVKLLARALGTSRSQVEIISGATSRHKRIAVPLDAEEARRRLGG